MQNDVNGEKKVNFIHSAMVLSSQEWKLGIKIGNSIKILLQCSAVAWKQC